MPYIDKDRLDRRLPCYFEDTGEDALVPVSAVSHMLAVATVDGVAPVEEVVNKIRASIRENMFNPYNKSFSIFCDSLIMISATPALKLELLASYPPSS
jgi:hypothetical protein